MTFENLVKELQTEMNRQGESLKVDGDLGPKTKAALEKFEAKFQLSKKPAPIISQNYFGAPWVFANIDLLGRHETDPELNARYVPEWALEGLPGYKTLSGNSFAWCSLRVNADMRKVGVKGTDRASASSWRKFGFESPFWFGAVLPITHADGKSFHVCNFLYWIDESKGICATYDGNRGNKLCIAVTDISGKGDKLTHGPRWPNDVPPGQILTKEQVLAVYPNLVPGAVGSGTK